MLNLFVAGNIGNLQQEPQFYRKPSQWHCKLFGKIQMPLRGPAILINYN